MMDSLSLPFQMDILTDLDIGNEMMQCRREEVSVRGRKRFKTRTSAILYDKLSDFEFKKTLQAFEMMQRELSKVVDREALVALLGAAPSTRAVSYTHLTLPTICSV